MTLRGNWEASIPACSFPIDLQLDTTLRAIGVLVAGAISDLNQTLAAGKQLVQLDFTPVAAVVYQAYDHEKEAAIGDARTLAAGIPVCLFGVNVPAGKLSSATSEKIQGWAHYA